MCTRSINKWSWKNKINSNSYNNNSRISWGELHKNFSLFAHQGRAILYITSSQCRFSKQVGIRKEELQHKGIMDKKKTTIITIMGKKPISKWTRSFLGLAILSANNTSNSSKTRSPNINSSNNHTRVLSYWV